MITNLYRKGCSEKEISEQLAKSVEHSIVNNDWGWGWVGDIPVTEVVENYVHERLLELTETEHLD